MWQSQVEIEHYSIAYFDRVAAFEVLQRSTSVKGKAHTCSEDYLINLHSAMSPTLNGSAALQHFEHDKTVEICNGMMFDFYPGLPQMLCTFTLLVLSF